MVVFGVLVLWCEAVPGMAGGRVRRVISAEERW